MNAYIEFQNVKKIHKMGKMEIQAFAGVDSTISKGEFVVIVGAGGVGKSTTLNTLGGVDSSASGSILAGGTEISKFNAKQLTTYRCCDIGFVFQFYSLVQSLIVKENVELATQICKQPLDIDETIEAIGPKKRASNFPARLPGGEQQRVAVARALAKNPKFLLCDEPTGTLDYNTGKRVLKLLQDTCRQRGVSVIVITHNLASAVIGDRVIKTRNGKIGSITVNEHPLPVERAGC